MNRSQIASIAALSAWAYNREQKLKDSKKGSSALMARFRNESEKTLYFKRLGMRPKRRRGRG